MHKSSIENVKMEPQLNSEPQPIVSTSPPAIGNTNVSCRFLSNKENSDNEGLNFVIELGRAMSIDGKVNVDRYCNILNLVAKYFVEKEETNDKPLSAVFLIETGFSEDNNGHFWLNLQTHYLELIPMADGYYPVYVQVPEMSSENEQRVSLIRIETVKQLKTLITCLSGKELQMVANGS